MRRFTNLFAPVVLFLIALFAVAAVVERLSKGDAKGALYAILGCTGVAAFIYIGWRVTIFNLDKIE
jgi:VIT1/CCC1 family predicted Fe2+/Mn2+ transporter